MRERLDKEKQSIDTAESNLQDEISKVGQELFASPTRATAVPSRLPLQSRIITIEKNLHTLTTELKTRVASAEKDLETSLAVADRRAKKLDDLYKEATAENEELYGRFNKELARAVKSVKAGPTEGFEEMKKQLADTMAELQKTKKENWSLKRMVAGLKAQEKE